MSSSSDDSVVLTYWYMKNLQKRKRKWWIHPYITKNKNRRAFIAAKELKKHEKKFQAYYRMSRKLFIELVQMVRPYLQKKDTNYRKSISVEERLLITLR